MKKILFTLSLALIFQISFSQDNDDFLPACVIINGAINLTDISQKDYVYSSKARPGFNAGAILRSNGDLFLLTGLQYVQVNPLVTDINNNESQKVEMHFLQIPLMAGVQIVKSKDLEKCFHAQLGGSFTSLLSVSENNFGFDENDFKKTGFTVKASLGADLWIFVADLNYNLLLTKVYEDPGYHNKAKLMSWEFSLGVKINLGGNKN